MEATVKELTRDEILDSLGSAENRELAQRWLARGDGIAVYENHDMGHPEVGNRLCVSYGSKEAQLDTDTPPQRLPDIGNRINWRYQLVGVFKGTLVPESAKRSMTRVVTMTAIRNCPNMILTGSHYRDDGSCRCDDPTHTEMSGMGYAWNDQAKRWKSSTRKEQ